MPMYGDSNYEPHADARTLQQAHEIIQDKGRHKAAHDHLTKMAESTAAAHKHSRKMLEKKTKGRLAKAFGPKPNEKSAPQMNQKDYGTHKMAKRGK